jgi:hypothetical protein
VNYWLWLEERQTRVREATAVDGHLPARTPRKRIRLPRLLAVRTVPPGRPDATQSAVATPCPTAHPN